MIYIETIADNEDLFRMERQKNTPSGKWYGVSLLWGLLQWTDKAPEIIASNDVYIIGELYPDLRDDPVKASVDLNIQLTKEDVKILLKLIRKADKLGWFDNIKE